MKNSEMMIRFLAQDIENQEEKIDVMKEQFVQDSVKASNQYSFRDLAMKATELSIEIKKLEVLKESYLRI